MGNIKELTKGIIKENPTLVGLLGMCPTLAVTTQAVNGIGMGLATTFVLLGNKGNSKGRKASLLYRHNRRLCNAYKLSASRLYTKPL